MRAKILLGACCFLAACSINTYNTRNIVVDNVTIASDWIGSHQSYDRSSLREFLGVDPVRTEWCAAFVNSVLNQAGIPGSDSVHRHPLLAKSFLDWGVAVAAQDIVRGDIVVFPRGNQGWQGHVGFYVNTVWEDGIEYWAILGGNQDNTVSIDLYPASRAIGIRRWPDTVTAL